MSEPPRKVIHVIAPPHHAKSVSNSGPKRYQVVTQVADYASPSSPHVRSPAMHYSTVNSTSTYQNPRGSVTPSQTRVSNVSSISRGYGSAPVKRPYANTIMPQPSNTLVRPRYIPHGRGGEKSKGLRHFSSKVCEKVKQKGRTNYNEVADELVQDYFESNHPLTAQDAEKQQYDMKNIRRRVYDALNVLMAMNVIEKEKKEIRWVGLPTSSVTECRKLEEEKNKRRERIQQKAEQLQELILQKVAYKSLVERNREMERQGGRPPTNSLLYLPYIIINTDKKTTIDCSISTDKTEYLFTFDQPFEIHDDIEVLKRLGLSQGLENANVPEALRPTVRSYLPKALRHYVDEICDGRLAKLIKAHEPQEIAPSPPATNTLSQLATGQLARQPMKYVTVQPRRDSNVEYKPTPPPRQIEIIERRGMGGAGHRLPPWHVRQHDPRAQSPSKVAYVTSARPPTSAMRYEAPVNHGPPKATVVYAVNNDEDSEHINIVG